MNSLKREQNSCYDHDNGFKREQNSCYDHDNGLKSTNKMIRVLIDTVLFSCMGAFIIGIVYAATIFIG